MPNDKPINTQTMTEWNSYVDWLKQRGLSGHQNMNHIDFSKSTLDQFRKENPNTTLTYDSVLPIQQAIRSYRDYAINQIKTGKGVAPPDTKPDFSNFMSWVTGTPNDGINGVYTSQFKFPHEYLVDLDKGTKTDLGYAQRLMNK
jgi:hypothetical protein